MSRSHRIVLLSLALGLCGSIRSVCAQAGPAPTTVYVFNGGANNQGGSDTFNTGCQGWIFQQMGLLGPLGEPPTIDGDNLKKPDGTVCGTVIRNGTGQIIGYRSADGTKEAYNVDTTATTAQAWQRVATNGTLVVAKHGVTYEDESGAVIGTGTTLDGGRSYPGYKPTGGAGGGTGEPGTPYPLPPRPGANISLYLNGCYTTDDPDGDGPRKSVADSAKDVPGVKQDGVTGNDGVIYKGIGLSYETQRPGDVARVDAALAACAKKAGFTKKVNGTDVGDIEAWINSLPFGTARQTIVDCIAAAGIRGVTVSVSFGKSTTGCGGGGESCPYYAPVRSMNFLGGSYLYQASPDRPFINFVAPQGAIVSTLPVPVYVHPISLDATMPPIPPGLTPASPVVSVGRYDRVPLQLVQPAVLMMSYWSWGPPQPTGLFTVRNGQWEPAPAQIVPNAGLVMTQVTGSGVYVVLQPEEPVVCRGDFNADGVVNSQDFFDFLGSFFALSPLADINLDGDVNSQDFFDFVTAFFTPC